MLLYKSLLPIAALVGSFGMFKRMADPDRFKLLIHVNSIREPTRFGYECAIPASAEFL